MAKIKTTVQRRMINDFNNWPCLIAFSFHPFDFHHRTMEVFKLNAICDFESFTHASPFLTLTGKIIYCYVRIVDCILRCNEIICQANSSPLKSFMQFISDRISEINGMRNCAQRGYSIKCLLYIENLSCCLPEPT